MRLAASTLEKVVDLLANVPVRSGPFYETPRVGLRASVTVVPFVDASIPAPFAATVHDVNEDGVTIRHNRPLDAGSQFTVIIPTGGRKPQRVLCTASHCRPADGGMFLVHATYGASAMDAMTQLLVSPRPRLLAA